MRTRPNFPGERITFLNRRTIGTTDVSYAVCIDNVIHRCDLGMFALLEDKGFTVEWETVWISQAEL